MSKRVQRNTRATALYQLLAGNTPFSELRVILIRPEDTVLFLNELGTLASTSKNRDLLRIGAYGFRCTDFGMYVPKILDGDVFMLGSGDVSDRWNSRIIMVSSDRAIPGHISLHDRCRLNSPFTAYGSAANRSSILDAALARPLVPIVVTANPDGIAVQFRCTKHTSDGAPGECDDPTNGFDVGVECFMRESHPPKPRAVQVHSPMSTPSRMHIDARLPPDIYQEVRYLVQRPEEHFIGIRSHDGGFDDNR